MNDHPIRRRFEKPLMAGILWLAVAVSPWAPATAAGGPVGLAQAPEADTGETMPPQAAALETRRPSASPGSALELTMAGAVLMALENNRSLMVEQLTPRIRKTLEDQEAAVFDPVVEGSLSGESADSRRPPGSRPDALNTDDFSGEIVLRNYFPSGTTVALEASARTAASNLYEDRFSEARLGLSVTQPLMRGRGESVNRVRLRQAGIDTALSAYELRGFVHSLIAQVENAYWEYGLAQRRIEIVEESLKLARQQLSDTEEMIRVGVLAESELAAVRAEVAVQLQGLINAKSAFETARLELLRLLNPPGENRWRREVKLVHEPTLPEARLDDVETHVAGAHRSRPEINQAKLEGKRGDLEVIRTRNGLLPKLDLFITLGKSGYADAFVKSFGDITEENYDAAAGVTFEFPIRNRDAVARHQRALLDRLQTEKAMLNLYQLVDLDVQKAYIEVNRSREQIAASTATRKLQEEKLRIETEKFRVGRSTNLLVAQAQRDLLESRINEVQAVVAYLNALTALYRFDGSLLERRGIEAPGGEAADSIIDAAPVAP